MQIDKSSTLGFLFGYFIMAKIFLMILGIFPFPLIWFFFDANIGLMIAILWGNLNYRWKHKKNERIRKGIFKRKNKG